MALPVHYELTLHEFPCVIRIVNFDERGWGLDENIAVGERSETSDVVGAGIPVPQVFAVIKVESDDQSTAGGERNVVLTDDHFIVEPADVFRHGNGEQNVALGIEAIDELVGGLREGTRVWKMGHTDTHEYAVVVVGDDFPGGTGGERGSGQRLVAGIGDDDGAAKGSIGMDLPDDEFVHRDVRDTRRRLGAATGYLQSALGPGKREISEAIHIDGDTTDGGRQGIGSADSADAVWSDDELGFVGWREGKLEFLIPVRRSWRRR